MSRYVVIAAETSYSREICDVLRRSITDLCVVDHGNDPEVLGSWLSNKTPQNIASWIEQSDGHAALALREGAVVGFALIRQADIMLNYVSPEHVGRGVGSMMLNALERWARAQGLEIVNCVSTITAKTFYEEHGYVVAVEPNVVGEIPMSKAIGI